jgi:BlaI family penicillinase repressor
MWHIDTTVIRLLDGIRAYLHAVIDNFSRRILAWRVADTFAPVNSVAVLLEASRGANALSDDAGRVGGCSHRERECPSRRPNHRGRAAPATMTKMLTFDVTLRHTVRPMATRLSPAKAELAILRVLWREGPLSVRAVQHILEETKPTGYTSVLKTMQIMTDKGLVERDETCRPQIYRARYSQTRIQKQLLSDLIDRVYGGSVKALVLHAIGTRKPSAKDLEVIEALLDRFEGGQT